MGTNRQKKAEEAKSRVKTKHSGYQRDTDDALQFQVKVKHDRKAEWGHVIYASAYQKYVCEAVGTKQVAEATGVPYNTIKMWIQRDNWIEKRKNIEQAIMANLESEALQLIKARRTEIMARHLQVGENMDKAINNVLIDKHTQEIADVDPESLRDLSQAFKNSADVQHRIAKISDKVDLAQQANQIFNGPVQINAAGTIGGKTIDI